MLNDSIVNFYMNYTLTEHIRDRLRLHHIDESDAETLLRKEHLSDPSLEEHVKKVLNEELLTFHVFSTFLYPAGEVATNRQWRNEEEVTEMVRERGDLPATMRVFPSVPAVRLDEVMDV